MKSWHIEKTETAGRLKFSGVFETSDLDNTLYEKIQELRDGASKVILDCEELDHVLSEGTWSILRTAFKLAGLSSEPVLRLVNVKPAIRRKLDCGEWLNVYKLEIETDDTDPGSVRWSAHA